MAQIDLPPPPPQKYVLFDAGGNIAGFYSSEVVGVTIPPEAMPITDAVWQDLASNQALRKLVDGEIVVLEMPPPPPPPLSLFDLVEELKARIEKLEAGNGA